MGSLRTETVPLLSADMASPRTSKDMAVNDTKVDASVSVSSEVDAVEEAFAKKVLRKIDWRLLPILFITFNFNFIDKTILSSASVFGLSKDTHLVGDQYSWVSSLFYFGYFFWEYPTTILIQKLPIGKYIAADIICWGAIVASTAACKNYGGLITVRFFTGVVEATISPAFLYVTAMWYTRDEMPSRMGMWYAGNSFGGAVASVLSYAIGHIDNVLSPWQWLYIIFGVATSIWGIIVLIFMPDTIATAKFLTEDERHCANERVAKRGAGVTMSIKNEWNFEQVKECLIDPKTWFFFSISLLTQMPNGGTQSFANLVLKGFGFSSLESTLVGLPASFISFSCILITGWLASRYRNITTILISTIIIPPVIGAALMNWASQNGVKLFGYYLLGFAHGAIPLTMSLIGSNTKGITKKMTMTAIMFIAFCSGNIAGPQLFKKAEAPHYPTAFKAILICYALASLASLGLRFYLIWVNKRRDLAEGTETYGTGTAAAAFPGATVSDVDYEDITDYNTIGFRYRL
ncbi:major facilitator superfamily transporter [Phlyctema vagabunda]|uniref:Major facilitator superfamily transporter n=1 Tax=Phlyctema vagabunda TaxID=108571 RepID=A0ABR4PTB6_9HELO